MRKVKSKDQVPLIILIAMVISILSCSWSSQLYEADTSDFRVIQQNRIKQVNELLNENILGKDISIMKNNLIMVSEIIYSNGKSQPVILEYESGYYSYFGNKIVLKEGGKYFSRFKDTKTGIYVSKKGEVILPFYEREKLLYLLIFNFYYDGILNLFPERLKCKSNYILREIHFEDFLITTVKNSENSDLVDLFVGYPIPIIEDENNRIVFSFKEELFHFQYIQNAGISIRIFQDELGDFIDSNGKAEDDEYIASLLRVINRDIIIVNDSIFIKSENKIYEIKNSEHNRRYLEDLINKEINEIHLYKNDTSNYLRDFNAKIIYNNKLKSIFRELNSEVLVGKECYYLYLKGKDLIVEIPIEYKKYFNNILSEDEVIIGFDKFNNFSIRKINGKSQE